DLEPPTIVCPANLTVGASGAEGSVVTFTPTASDDSGTVAVMCTPPSGTVFPLGVSDVTCLAVDPSGNSASCTFQVAVVGAFDLQQTVLDDLIQLRARVTAKQERKELGDAIKELTKALAPSLWIDQTHLQPEHGQTSFDKVKETLRELRELLKHKKSSI